MIDEDLAREIREAVAGLGWPESRFRILADDEALEVWRGVEARFVSEPGIGGWWWARFRPEPVSARYVDPSSLGYRHIAEVVPPDSGPLWLIAGNGPNRSIVVCETTIEDIRDVIAECYGFEYDVVPKDLSWLLCENHHDVLIAVGDPIRPRLLDMAARHPEDFAASPTSGDGGGPN